MNKELRDKYAIVGIGQSKIGEVPGVGSQGLLAEAMRNALEDAGIDKREVDGLITRGPTDVYTHHQRIGELLGINAAYSTTLDNGGASQCLAVIQACLAIDAGLAQTVLCGYGRNAWSRTRESGESRRGSAQQNAGAQEQLAKEFGPEFGYFGAVATHAFGARRHMFQYGTTKEQLGAVAVSFREHAVRTPWAQMRKPLTMADYLQGRPIVEPFNLYDCSLRTDAGGAVVVTSAERAKSLRHPPVYIRGFGSYNNLQGWFNEDHMVSTAAGPSGQAAFRMAGIAPEEVDTAQLYDCFTYMVIAELEDYGFCAKGEGGPFVASGALKMNGVLPTNTAGGQLSEGHVEGMLQILEAVRQVRQKEPEERQVPGAEVALVSGHGGNAACHSTLILRR